MREILEQGVLRRLDVELLFEHPKGADDLVRGIDGIDAGLHFARVRRPPVDAHREPDDADVGVRDAAVRRLRADRGIGAIAAHRGRERAVAGALLLGDRLHVDRRGGLEAGAA